MAKNFTLGKEERLKSRKLIDELFKTGNKFTSGFFRVHFRIAAAAGSVLQFGVGVSTKNFKKAVDRNRVKRLTREAWRLQKNKLKDQLKASSKGLNVFLIYTGKTLPEYTDVVATVQKIIERLYKNCIQTT